MPRFDKFFQEMLKNEGVFSDDPDDKGGATIWGISSYSFPATYKAIMELFMQGKRDIALEMAKKFYRTKFYNPLYDEIQNEQIAFKLFDIGVNIGKVRCIKILQRILKVKVDGCFGRISLDKTNQLCPLNEFINALEDYYKSLHNPKYEKGWLNRLHRMI